jgi:UDPglucose 6-dehydrogenase
VKALARTARSAGYEPLILDAVESVNARQKQVLFRRLEEHFHGDLAGRTVAVWGLAFKPNTDDMREAPSRDLMEALWAAGAHVRAYDPEAADEAQRIYGDRADLTLCEGPYDALEGADVLAICTEWQVFRSPDFERIKSLLRTPAIFDGRNLYEPRTLNDHGFVYYAIGRGDSVRSNGA